MQCSLNLLSIFIATLSCGLKKRQSRFVVIRARFVQYSSNISDSWVLLAICSALFCFERAQTLFWHLHKHRPHTFQFPRSLRVALISAGLWTGATARGKACGLFGWIAEAGAYVRLLWTSVTPVRTVFRNLNKWWTEQKKKSIHLVQIFQNEYSGTSQRRSGYGASSPNWNFETGAIKKKKKSNPSPTANKFHN